MTKGPLEELSQSFDPDKLSLWTEEEEDRGEALDIYSLKMAQGWFLFPSLHSNPLYLNEFLWPAPTLAAMRLGLVEAGKAISAKQGSVTWLVDRIFLEDAK
jgi:hypothetical protein